MFASIANSPALGARQDLKSVRLALKRMASLTSMDLHASLSARKASKSMKSQSSVKDAEPAACNVTQRISASAKSVKRTCSCSKVPASARAQKATLPTTMTWSACLLLT